MKEANIYCIIPTRWHSRKGKTVETVKRLVFQGLERREE